MQKEILIYQALGHLRRLRILEELEKSKEKSETMSYLNKKLNIPIQSLAFHLEKLEKAQIVSRSQKGSFVLISLNKRFIGIIQAHLKSFK